MMIFFICQEYHSNVQDQLDLFYFYFFKEISGFIQQGIKSDSKHVLYLLQKISIPNKCGSVNFLFTIISCKKLSVRNKK